MSNDTARVLNAKSPMTVKFGKKELEVRALGLRELAEVEQDCLDRYRRSYLETWSKNLDLIPNGETILLDKIEEAAKWDIDELPTKFAFNPASVIVTKQLKIWIASNFSIDLKKLSDNRAKLMAATALDKEMMDKELYKKFTGHGVISTKVSYVNWWITSAYDGMITFIWTCFKIHDISREEVSRKMSGDMALMTEVSREIERLSSPAVGNG